MQHPVNPQRATAFSAPHARAFFAPYAAAYPVKRTMAYAALAAATSLLVACGGGGDSSTSTPVAAPAPTPVVTAATCGGKTSAKIGEVAVLTGFSHLVSGKATVIDDCTIELTNFNYDGLGRGNVFAYGAINKAFTLGFGFGPNLFGTRFTNSRVTLTLKPGELDKMDSISIWCVDLNANFGDGKFAKP